MSLVNALLFAALVAVLSHQGNLNISVIDPIVSVRYEADGTRITKTLFGQAHCEVTKIDGKVVSWRVSLLTHDGSPGALEEEALHGADCADDGKVNGSLLPHPPTEVDAAHEWVGWAFQHPDEAIAIMEGLTK